jgi:hypothetical protein
VPRLAAAYELDYFQAITRGDSRVGPFCFGKDLEIVFDGYAGGAKA